MTPEKIADLRTDTESHGGIASSIMVAVPRCWVLDLLATAESAERLLEAMPTLPHPGGRLVKVVAHYEDGSTQTIHGDVITAAVSKATE